MIHEECQQLVLSLVLLNAENVIGATTVSDRVLQLQEVQQFGSGFGLDVHVGLDSWCLLLWKQRCQMLFSCQWLLLVHLAR